MIRVSTHQSPSARPAKPFELVCVAASWGGVQALESLLASLPENFPAAIAVVIHINHQSSYLVNILQRATRLPVQWARDGAVIMPGTVTVAVANQHLLVERPGLYQLSSAPKLHYVRPAADLLFMSAAQVYGDQVIGVVLTGLGRDGAVGSRAIKNDGGRILVQDRLTSQRFDMPQAAIETGAVDFVLPLDQLGIALQAMTVPGMADYFRVSAGFSFSHVHKAHNFQYPSPASKVPSF